MGQVKYSIYLCMMLVTGLVFHLKVEAQSYPIKIPEGTTQEVTAENQDFWVLKESQFDSALAHSKRMKILDEQVSELRKQISKMQQKALEQTTLVDTLKHDRDFYKEKWQSCEDDLGTMSSMRNTERRWKKFFKITTFAGIPAAFLVGLLAL